MVFIKRLLAAQITKALARDKSVLLFGARQTGKTTLLNQIAADLRLSFIDPLTRQLYEKNPSTLKDRVLALPSKKAAGYIPTVIIDEAQKIPAILDVAQDLIDRNLAKFIFIGSSARKLRANKLNLLPGRVVVLTLMPLNLLELPLEKKIIENLLVFGSLPGIIKLEDRDSCEIDLQSYVTTYLEEEIRAEAAVRNVASFAKFLELSAAESGNFVNFSKLSQEIGVAHTTISAYYQILEDCLVAERVEPFSRSKTRRRLVKTPKYLFFDLGIRRLAAAESSQPTLKQFGILFEHFIGLELIRLTKSTLRQTKLYFWKDANGPEVDWLIEKAGELIPLEVKWTLAPTVNDAKHLRVFLTEYKNSKNAYIVCRVPHKLKLAEKIFALPWQDLPELIM